MRILTLLLLSVLLFQACQKEVDWALDEIDVPADSLTIRYFLPDSVRAGGSVTIVGSGFDSTIANIDVTINGVPLTITSLNDTMLVVAIPDSAATGKVSISVNGKTIVSEDELVILSDPPVPSEHWIQKADYPGVRDVDSPDQPQSFSLNGKGYFLWFNKLWEYSPSANSWVQKAQLPSSKIINHGFCFTIGDKAYVGLGAAVPGDDISGYKEVWEYNGTGDTWTQKRDFPGPPRVVPFSFSIGATGYIGGGDTLNAGVDEGYVFDAWKYESATDNWVQIANFPGNRALGLSGVNIANIGFVVEAGANNPTAALKDYEDVFIWRYDPATDSWLKRAKMPLDSNINYQGGGTSFVINDKVYVGLGTWDSITVNGQVIRENFWEYDPFANQWTKKEDIGGGLRLFGKGFSINGRGYIGLGTGETVDAIKQDFWEYTP